MSALFASHSIDWFLIVWNFSPTTLSFRATDKGRQGEESKGYSAERIPRQLKIAPFLGIVIFLSGGRHNNRQQNQIHTSPIKKHISFPAKHYYKAERK